MADKPKTAAAPPAPPKPAGKQRFHAKLRYARMSARKMRYVVDLVRGKDYNSAIGILRMCAKRGAPSCKKLLESAYENAMDIARNKNLDIDGNKLHLVGAFVDGGPVIKRWRPSSVRRPTMIKKRTCHVTFVLEEREPKESKKDRAKRQRQERKLSEKAKAPPTPAAKPVETKAPEPPKTPEPPTTDEKKG